MFGQPDGNLDGVTKVAAAIKRMANAKTVVMLAGVVTCVMKLAQKVRVLKGATAKLASQFHVSKAVVALHGQLRGLAGTVSLHDLEALRMGYLRTTCSA